MTDQGSYSKGYAAGRRRVAAVLARERMEVKREDFKREVFLAVLPELIRAPWQSDGVTWTSIEQFVGGAAHFANSAAKRFTYPVEPDHLPNPITERDGNG